MKTVPAPEHQALLDAYKRLRRAARAGVDAADYAANGEDEARVYADSCVISNANWPANPSRMARGCHSA
jgi:hypothetical protein